MVAGFLLPDQPGEETLVDVVNLISCVLIVVLPLFKGAFAAAREIHIHRLDLFLNLDLFNECLLSVHVSHLLVAHFDPNDVCIIVVNFIDRGESRWFIELASPLLHPRRVEHLVYNLLIAHTLLV